MINHIIIECMGLSRLPLSKVANFYRTLFLAIEKVDRFLLDSLEGDFKILHSLDEDSLHSKPKINFALNVAKDFGADKMAALCAYLAKGRHTILTADYQKVGWDNELVSVLTEAAIEVESLVYNQQTLYDTKILNRIALATAIEKVTSIDAVGKNGLGIRICAGKHQAELNALTKRKAENLLGGKWMDKEPRKGNFVVSKIPFNNIQKRSEFQLDGCPVTVFIVDMRWVRKFNSGKIKLAKDDRVVAKALIERSPVSKKAVAYYFVEVSGPNP